MLDEQSDDGEVLVLRGEVQWHRVVTLIANVRIGAALEEHSDNSLVLDTEMQCRAKSVVTLELATPTHDLRIAIENLGDSGRHRLGSQLRVRHRARLPAPPRASDRRL